MTLTPNQDAFLGRLVTALHKDRASIFRVLPETDLGSRSLGAYALNVAACEAFYPLLHVVEIAFRNSLDKTIAAYGYTRPTAGISSWLDQTPSVLSAKSANEVAIARDKLLMRARKEKRQPPAHSDLVASLDFGFWTALLSTEYNYVSASDPRFNWPTGLNKVFPHFHQQIHSQQSHTIRTAFNEIRKFRNRVFHHEPILPKVGIVRLTEVDRELQAKRAWLLNAIGWISPELRLVVAGLDRVSEIVEPSFYRELCFSLIRFAPQ